jgi:hypothetical protein
MSAQVELLFRNLDENEVVPAMLSPRRAAGAWRRSRVADFRGGFSVP